MRFPRLIIIFVFLFATAIFFIGRLFFLQVIQGDYYQALARGQHSFLQETSGKRGQILFKQGELLATNRTQDILYLPFQKICGDAVLLQSLKDILGNPLEELEEGRSMTIILESEEITKIQDLNLSFLTPQKRTVRYYPQGEMASHLVGFLNAMQKGQYGIEEEYQEELQGEKGVISWGGSPYGYLVSKLQDNSVLETGNDVSLTLDYGIQFMAEQLLKEAEKDLAISSGTIIVTDPKTGGILAMANYPNFDPNNYRQEELESFQNSAIQKLFEPGSIFKAFTMAAGLNEGKVTPETTFKDKGYIDLGGSLIRNYDRRTWGKQTMIEVLKKSINTGAVFVEQELGRELFLKYSKRFGFTQLTGIDLVGETYSRNENLVNGCERDLASASFGQGIAVTPIQLVSAFGAIANNGKLMKPFVVSSIQGKEATSSKSSKQVITSNSASQLTSMLTQVVEEGFGRKAGIPGYFLAGKTGTAQVINEEGVYDPNKTIQSFIGFGPTLDPQFLILIKLDGPQAKSSSESAAPIFKKMAQYIINRYQIPPTVESL